MEKTLYQREYRILLDLLREARQKANVNQEDLAKGMGMTQSMVSKCERGERRLDVIEVRRWCGILGLPFPTFAQQFESTLQVGRKKGR